MKYNKERVEYLLSLEKSKEVVEELLLLNFGLVGKQLQRFGLYNDPDALSFGYEALYKAIMTFDNNKNAVFSTYATVCIYNALGCYIRSLNTEMATSVDSYDAPIDEEGSTLLDVLESPLRADSRIMDEVGIEVIMGLVYKTFYELSNPKHKQIVKSWIDSNFKKVHVKIAEEVGVTQTYVSQVIKAYKFKLKNKLEAEINEKHDAHSRRDTITNR